MGRNKGEGYGTPLTRSETFVGWRSKESIVTIVESIESKTKKLITEKKGQQQQQQQHQGQQKDDILESSKEVQHISYFNQKQQSLITREKKSIRKVQTWEKSMKEKQMRIKRNQLLIDGGRIRREEREKKLQGQIKMECQKKQESNVKFSLIIGKLKDSNRNLEKKIDHLVRQSKCNQNNAEYNERQLQVVSQISKKCSINLNTEPIVNSTERNEKNFKPLLEDNNNKSIHSSYNVVKKKGEWKVKESSIKIHQEQSNTDSIIDQHRLKKEQICSLQRTFSNKIDSTTSPKGALPKVINSIPKILSSRRRNSRNNNNKTNIANKANKEINVEDLQLDQQDSLHLSSIHHQMVHQQKSTSQNRFYERGGNTAIKEKRNLENQRRNTPKRRKCASRVVIRLDISSESEASVDY